MAQSKRTRSPVELGQQFNDLERSIRDSLDHIPWYGEDLSDDTREKLEDARRQLGKAAASLRDAGTTESATKASPLHLDDLSHTPEDDFTFAHASALVVAEMLIQTQDEGGLPDHTLENAGYLITRMANEMRDAFYNAYKRKDRPASVQLISDITPRSEGQKTLAMAMAEKFRKLEAGTETLDMNECATQLKAHGWTLLAPMDNPINSGMDGYVTLHGNWTESGVQHFLALLDLLEFFCDEYDELQSDAA